MVSPTCQKPSVTLHTPQSSPQQGTESTLWSTRFSLVIGSAHLSQLFNMPCPLFYFFFFSHIFSLWHCNVFTTPCFIFHNSSICNINLVMTSSKKIFLITKGKISTCCHRSLCSPYYQLTGPAVLEFPIYPIISQSPLCLTISMRPKELSLNVHLIMTE